MVFDETGMNNDEVGGQAVLGRQDASPTPWLTERHGYDPTSGLVIRRRIMLLLTHPEEEDL